MILRRLQITVFFLIMPGLCLCTCPAAHAQKTPGEDKRISLDFSDVGLTDVAKVISEITGKNFLLDKDVKGKVTLVSPSKVTPKQAYEIFLAVLEVNNFAVVKQGAIHKIVSKRTIARESIPTRTEPARAPTTSDRYITQLIPLTNLEAGFVSSVFHQLVSKEGEMIPHLSTNTLIVVDTEANVRRISKILKELDVKGIQEQIEVIRLKYASAAMLTQEILAVFEKEKATTTRRRSRRSRRSRKVRRLLRQMSRQKEIVTRIIPDERTNSLIVKANRPALRKIKSLIAMLDVPLPGGEGKIHVHYVQNADAEELASVLQAVVEEQGRRPSKQRHSSSRSRSRRTPSIPATVPSQFEGAIQISADEPTNSLLIIATNRDYEILKQVIEKLDIMRRQVFVEAVIAEITLDKSRELGFEARSPTEPEPEGFQILGGTGFGGIESAGENPLGIMGLAIGAADGTVTLAGETFPNLVALFRALKADKDVNVLSTPSILTMNNEEAEIVVADNVPFVTGQVYSQGVQGPTTTIERKDVGINLKILPQINESDYVTLEIYQEVSNVTESPEGLSAANVGVTTSKRSATTTVVVKDEQTVVIGGLIEDDASVVEQKVPLLGDIPLLGYLFKSQKKQTTKTNLVIFITPYIIQNAKDLEAVKQRHELRLRQFEEGNEEPEKKREKVHVDQKPGPNLDRQVDFKPVKRQFMVY